MPRVSLVLAAALVALPALSPAALAAPAPADPGTPTGAAPRDCLNPRLIRSTRIVDDKTLLFRVGRDWFRNDLPQGGCPGLRPDRAFSYQTPIGQLCSVDTITVFDPSVNVTYGSCSLGKFVPVKLAAR